MLYQGAVPAPVYGDAPEQRYVWAPPEVRSSAVAPLELALPVDPIPGSVVAESPTASVVGEDARLMAVAHDPRESGA
jgi:hypothetical protein